MKIIVDKDLVKIEKKPYLHRGEYGVHKCEFEFSEEYEGLVKVAVFQQGYETYKIDIINNICDIPSEVLERTGRINLGVYAYALNEGVLQLRYSPANDTLFVDSGSYVIDGKTPTEITPTQYEMYSSELNKGLEEVNAVKEQLLEDKANGVFNGEKGEKGDAGSVKFVVANELPTENIDESAIYMIANGDIYDEYIYVNETWESLGGASVNVDMTGYYTKEEIDNITGDPQKLETESKQLVGAINEVLNNSGGGIPTLHNQEIDLTTIESGIYFITGTSSKIKYSASFKDSGFIKSDTQKDVLLVFGATDNGYARGVLFTQYQNNKSQMVCYTYNGKSTYYLDTLMTTSGYQMILGTKNFATIPECSVTPTSDTHMVNKKYVDDAIANAITTTLEGEY